MNEENLTKSTHGGKRSGAGRPKGAKQKAPKKPSKEYVKTFYVRCTSYEQYDKLKAYWEIIKNTTKE